jgi:hypothetical protein
MANTETGVYVQFFDEDESPQKELPPLGPFELLIIRHNRIIGDREHVEHDMMNHGSVERWLEAELELRRALGDEPGGQRRSHARIRAPRGDIIVRFYDYAGDEAPKVPELGPFYSLTVGKRDVRADDKLLAVRATDMSPWTLTDQLRPGIAGINKADFSVFSLSARDPVRHQPAQAAPPPTSVTVLPPPPTPDPQPTAAPAASAPEPVDPQPAAPLADFVERRKVQREIYVARPVPTTDPSLTPADVNLILRVDKLKQQELAEQLMIERLRRQQHTSPEVALRADAPASLPMRFQPPVREREAARHAAADDDRDSFTARLLGFLWSARLAIVTVLLVGSAVSAYGYLQPKVASNAAPPPLTVVALGDKVQSTDWTYNVTSVERSQRIGTVPANNGGYLIVHVTVAKKSPDAIPLTPSDFMLIDGNGGRSLALSSTSDVYAKSTGLTWAAKYSTNTAVQNHLAFDVSPTARDLQLLIRSANAQVRLPDP